MDLCNAQTIKDLLGRQGFSFSKSLGQNFLTARWVIDEMIECAGLDAGTGVLEIGPGIGCLTAELAEHSGKVAAVELDRRLEPLLHETLAGFDNVELIFSDVLKLDIQSLVRECFPGLFPVVCANLPYNITTPLLTRLIDARCFEYITVMVQREVARRICAEPGTSDYGAFSVYARWHTVPEIVFDIPPDCFMPRPKVWSSVVRLTVRGTPPVAVASEKFFERVVRAAFMQRRKTLRNAIGAGFPELTKAEAEWLIINAGIDPGLRGEVLGCAEFATIADAIYEYVSSESD